MNWIFRLLFHRLGWKISGELDASLRKGIIAVAPHWDTNDFFIGLGARATLRRKIAYLGKAELFAPPFGFVFRALGGIPVYRSENRNQVESSVQAIAREKDALIALAPEGTRKNVNKLKSGFYYIAYGAGVPIIRVGFDKVDKKVIIAEPFHPSGDFEADMNTYFVPFFERVGGPQKDWIKHYKAGNFSVTASA